MKAIELDVQAASNKWFAARDAAVRSYAQSTAYSEAQKVQAERMKQGLTLVYAATAFHINFRKKFIVVKVDAPIVRERKMLALLEQDYVKAGIVKVKTAQGLCYRIPKQ